MKQWIDIHKQRTGRTANKSYEFFSEVNAYDIYNYYYENVLHVIIIIIVKSKLIIQSKK